jgi:hypothetical protein
MGILPRGCPLTEGFLLMSYDATPMPSATKKNFAQEKCMFAGTSGCTSSMLILHMIPVTHGQGYSRVNCSSL